MWKLTIKSIEVINLGHKEIEIISFQCDSLRECNSIINVFEDKGIKYNSYFEYELVKNS